MADPIPTYTYLVTELGKKHPKLAYIHLVEPRFDTKWNPDSGASNDFIRAIWSPKPLITAGAYERDSAIATADEKGDLIAFSRYYISNVSAPMFYLW